MTRAVVALVLALATALSAGCSCENLRANTQVMVTIDAEDGVRGMSRRLLVRVYGAPAGQTGVPEELVQEFPFPVSPGDGWPVTVALAPLNRDPSRRYRIEAVAQTTAGTEVATVRAISGYAEGQTLWLRLLLLDGCIGVTCDDPGQTCIGPDMCEDATVDPDDLPRFDPDAGTIDRDDAGTGDGGPPQCDPTACDDGLSCTDDFCTAEGACGHTRRDAMCDDDNPCTDDACSGEAGDGPSGCSFVPNAVDCDDGVFCNGLDTCSAGVCGHGGDPCTAPLTCDEDGDQCLGCADTGDCPDPLEGAYGACAYGSTCAESGTESRTVRTFACVSGACVPSDSTESRACSRDTDGSSCGTTSFGEWSCGGFADTCDTSGTEMRSRIQPTCQTGECMPVSVPETRPCSRTTNDLPCSDGNGCTNPDRCSAGVCVGGPSTCMDAGSAQCDAGSCDDGVGCTDDVCSGAGCMHVPNDTLCSPPFGCGTSWCDPSSGCVIDTSGCYSDAGVDQCETSAECDDGNPCTENVCVTLMKPYYCYFPSISCFPDGGATSRDGGTMVTLDSSIGSDGL